MPNPTVMTVLEAVKRDGNTADQRRIIEALAVTNELLLDMPVFEANDTTGMNHLIRTAIPKGQHRGYNEGVTPEVSQTEVTRDISVQVTGYSKVDEKLVREQNDPRGFRQGEDMAYIAGMAETMAEDLIYGNNSTNPRLLNGFAVRRPKLVADKCIGMGGTGNALTSVYLCKMGKDNVSMFYPKGASGCGVKMVDKGLRTEKDANGGEFEAYVTYFEMNYGLSVGNDKSLVRICNIDVTSTTGENLAKKIVAAAKKLPKGEGEVICYANTEVLNLIDMYLIDKANIQYSPTDQYGKEVTKIRQIKFRTVDAILNTESAVTA